MKIFTIFPLEYLQLISSDLTNIPFSCTLSKAAQTATVSFSSNKLVLTYNPLRIDVYAGEELVASINARGLFHVETQLLKPLVAEICMF